MKPIYYIILGLALASLVWLRILMRKKLDTDLEGNPLLPEAIAKRRENLNKILEMANNLTRLTNDDVQKALGVSDATATRYLTYLTDLGKLVMVGERGQRVYYQLPPK